jgi:hypothetical protein
MISYPSFLDNSVNSLLSDTQLGMDVSSSLVVGNHRVSFSVMERVLSDLIFADCFFDQGFSLQSYCSFTQCVTTGLTSIPYFVTTCERSVQNLRR